MQLTWSHAILFRKKGDEIPSLILSRWCKVRQKQWGKAALGLLLLSEGQAEGHNQGRVDAWDAAGIRQPLASHNGSASLVLSPVQVVTGKWGQALVSPIKAELCSSTGSWGWMCCCPKSSTFSAWGRRQQGQGLSLQVAPTLVDTYSNLHETMSPPFGVAETD